MPSSGIQLGAVIHSFLPAFMAVSTEDQRTSVWLFSRMEAEFERSSGKKLRTLRSDNGGEYTSTRFETWISEIWGNSSWAHSLTTFEIVVLHVQSRNDAVWSMAWYKTKGGSFESVQLWILCPHPQRWEKQVRFQGKKMHTVGIRRQDQRIRLFDPIHNKVLHTVVMFVSMKRRNRSDQIVSPLPKIWVLTVDYYSFYSFTNTQKLRYVKGV